MARLRQQDRLLWLDILILRLIISHIERHTTPDNPRPQPPSQRALYHPRDKTSIINDWLTENRVDKVYAQPLTGGLPLTYALEKLRRLGFLAPKGEYIPQEKAYQFFEVIGYDWQQWPLDVPIAPDNTLDFTKALFPPEF